MTEYRRRQQMLWILPVFQLAELNPHCNGVKIDFRYIAVVVSDFAAFDDQRQLSCAR